MTLGKFYKVFNGDRCLLLLELSLHIALLGRDNSIFHNPNSLIVVFQILCKDKNKLLNEKEKVKIKDLDYCDFGCLLCFVSGDMWFNV